MKIDFENQKKQLIIKKIQNYFEDELDSDIGNFDAEFLLDFFVMEVGPFIYNRALNDVKILIREKLSDFEYSIYELEKPE